MTDEKNNKICTYIKVEFKRNNRAYIKDYIYIMISYNKNENKIFICNISLIKNDNFETFNSIINYLKLNYQFELTIMTVDICKAVYKAFKTNYKNIRMVPFNF